MSISEKFINTYFGTSYNDLNAETIQASKNLLIDCIGNIVASCRVDKNIELNTSFKNALNNKNEFLPFYLGMLIHRLDFDDTHYEALIHTGSITVPSAIYSSLNKRLDGEKFLQSIALGVDFAVKLAGVEKHIFHKKGFHATSVVGPFSSALIYSYLNGFSKEQSMNAIGIAGSFSSGNLSFLREGDNTKIIHPGWASFSGCKAGAITNYSITGSKFIFEDEFGFYNLYSDVVDIDKKIETNFDVSEINKVNFKPYPICQLNIASVRLFDDLNENIDVSKISKLIVHLPQDSYEIVAENKESKCEPRSPYEAKFSIYWTIAAYLLDKNITVDSFSKEHLRDLQVIDLAKKIEIKTFEHKEEAASIKGKVEILFKDNTQKIFEEEGQNDSILNTEKVINKFLQNTNLSHDTELLQDLNNLEQSNDVGKIIKGIFDECIKEY